ncbi:MAG: phosphate ABC transporter permease PstA, partial [archaeon]|nr:phosphate ABC transporter permease PstA [archaeon]
MAKRITRRKIVDKLVASLALLSVVLAIIPLAGVIIFVASKGLTAINLEFFASLPKPPDEIGGGIGNAIQGTLILIGLASMVGIPIGVLSGIYLAEYGNNKFGSLVRFMADVLSGVPSIIMGLFVYVAVVLTTRSFSALSGGIALGIMMIPVITRTTEESVKIVPNSIREASMALGIRRWKTILFVVLSTAKSGIITGIMLSIARIAGETAPLLFTAFGSDLWATGLNQPISALPLVIYKYAISP